MIKDSLRQARWALLLIFPVGWYVSAQAFGDRWGWFTLLNAASFLIAAFMIHVLGPMSRYTLHLWVVFGIYLLAYYVKFYVMCLLKLGASPYFAREWGRELELLESTKLLDNYFSLITTVLATFAACLVFMRTSRGPSRQQNGAGLVASGVVRRRLMRLVFVTAGVAVIGVSVQAILGIGLVSGAERQSVELPFRLAGVIQTINNVAMPLLFLSLICISDAVHARRAMLLSTGGYVALGVAAGLVSTSKALAISVLLSLLLLWVLTGKLTRRRRMLLLGMVPAVLVLNVFLSVNRMARAANPDLSIPKVMLQSFALLVEGSNATALVDQLWISEAPLLDLVMRINGADATLNILYENPQLFWGSAVELLFGSAGGTAAFYARDILQYHTDVGVAFSPSLLGFFTIIFGAPLSVCLGFAAYVFLWHGVFILARRVHMLLQPVLLATLAVLLAQFTSEGTLEGLPFRILALFVLLGLIERWLRAYCFRKGAASPHVPASPLTVVPRSHAR